MKLKDLQLMINKDNKNGIVEANLYNSTTQMLTGNLIKMTIEKSSTDKASNKVTIQSFSISTGSDYKAHIVS